MHIHSHETIHYHPDNLSIIQLSSLLQLSETGQNTCPESPFYKTCQHFSEQIPL